MSSSTSGAPSATRAVDILRAATEDQSDDVVIHAEPEEMDVVIYDEPEEMESEEMPTAIEVSHDDTYKIPDVSLESDSAAGTQEPQVSLDSPQHEQDEQLTPTLGCSNGSKIPKLRNVPTAEELHQTWRDAIRRPFADPLLLGSSSYGTLVAHQRQGRRL